MRWLCLMVFCVALLGCSTAKNSDPKPASGATPDPRLKPMTTGGGTGNAAPVNKS